MVIQLPSRAKTLALVGGAVCTMFGGVVLWKEALAGKKYEHIKEEKDIKAAVDGKVFVITGANSGIGKETALELARKKGKIYMACRDMGKCETARQEIVLSTKNKFVYCRKCDLADFESIRKFVDSFQAQEEKCDVLINNAGVMNCRKMFTSDGIETQLGVNHMGPFLLSHLLKPSLLKAGKSRIVYLMNLDYRKGSINFADLNSSNDYNKSTAFNQSQLANMLAVQHLSSLWQKEGITVNAVYPGVCSTDIKRHMGVDKSISGYTIANPLMWFLTKSAERGAQTAVFAAIDQDIENATGKLYSNMVETEVDKAALDTVLANKMYLVTQYWTGLVDKETLVGRGKVE